ncbi:hypothetical protein QWZ13_05595 [Reinekea marina]|nr:hypothetical protein [Reinekea marina]MDN3648379.1 hypothetical protein [Reinekea marina]
MIRTYILRPSKVNLIIFSHYRYFSFLETGQAIAFLLAHCS